MDAVANSIWLTPAIIVASLGLILQGIKACWDLWISINDQQLSKETAIMQRLSAFLHVSDGMPIQEAEKIQLKIDLISKAMEEKKPDLLKIMYGYL